MDKFQITAMTLKDFESIQNIFTSDFDSFWNSSILKQELLCDNSHFIVAKNGNEIIGTCKWRKSRQNLSQPVQHPDQSLCHQPAEPRDALFCPAYPGLIWERDCCRSEKDILNKPPFILPLAATCLYVFLKQALSPKAEALGNY